ncbi:hypothetical protein SELMODRAFT_270132 [Selaginella moellendorffii]|uniref:Rhodanese domain-containing protein n=1 Tax=Selaginella moellendorffii TaxID=88036 RepID=D8TF87_SELML|nr:hypothetical protein SELMODRAFT_270132 [Selaginella moellendorffii]
MGNPSSDSEIKCKVCGDASKGQGVLLYYKFVTLPDPEATRDWFERSCSSLALLGRIRIAPGGVNVTVGGSMESLREHIDAVARQELFQGCDFKLAACSRPMDRDAAASCGLDSLSVRLVEQSFFRFFGFLGNRVTLGVFPSPSLANAGKHLSPEQFHGMLDQADERAEQLRNKSVLMYFTGGVRCEMASAYIRSKGEEFENVYQVVCFLVAFSGIWRHFLKEDTSMGRTLFSIIGRYQFHRYKIKLLAAAIVANLPTMTILHGSVRSMCRMLVLLCESCKASVPYLCELCAANRHSSEPVESGRDKCSKLRILCLHGFRQNASNLKGRLASLSKKLRRTAEFVFIDAPHELPLLYQLLEDETRREPTAQPHKKFAWLTDPDGPKASTQTWTPVQKSFDPMQYQKQTSGWSESWEYLGQVLADRGPFDGVLGFSQGAAVAAILSSLKDAGLIDIKFVVLCSGFVSPVLEQQVLGGLIDCPSLHIFSGKTGYDRQISCTESERLAGKFRPGSRMIVRHDSGHIVPTRPDYLEQYSEFFKQFL